MVCLWLGLVAVGLWAFGGCRFSAAAAAAVRGFCRSLCACCCCAAACQPLLCYRTAPQCTQTTIRIITITRNGCMKPTGRMKPLTKPAHPGGGEGGVGVCAVH